MARPARPSHLHSPVRCRRNIYAFILLALGLGCARPPGPSRVTTAAYPLIPFPAQLRVHGDRLSVRGPLGVTVPGSASAQLREALSAWTASVTYETGLEVRATAQAAGTPIQLRLEPSASANPEGYRLSITPSAIQIDAPAEAGLYYGLQTLRQLLPKTGEPTVLRALEITDAPRFVYRGMHLDVARHFFPVAFIKKYLDVMALYKLNTFHWHLTEDQGWRLEIRQYPRLTEVGGCRQETMVAKNFNPYVGDGSRYCGFYTQAEAREIVEYARARFITVIPEIEMPGHAVAALAAYPEFACTPGPFEVGTRWGVYDDVFCPKEETFRFLEDVLNEVTQIFPSRYVHIGGDEVPKKRWQESELAQSVIRRENLKDEHELQSYFIRRVEQMLHARQRRLIGWDEILEGGLAPDATVMSWRGTAGGVAAAREGHDVIMSPNSHLYFDHYQGSPQSEPLAIGGNSPLEKVYSYEPQPPELTAAEARHILGAQANVWTEYIKTSDHVEYMVFPRLLALSEVVWSPKELRDWDSFRGRLPAQLRRLDRLGVRYRPL
ncbi:MAG: beta-N-acetylhexosaminidase [Longimicrobiales bacterium]